MNKKLRIAVSMLVLMFSLLFTACGTKKDVSDKRSNSTIVSENKETSEDTKKSTNNAEDTKSSNDNKVNKDDKKQNIEVDEEVTQKVESESSVEQANVYISDGSVKGAILLKKGTSEVEAKKIAEKYANELKQKYKDKEINVQAVSDGENLANIKK